MVWFYASIENKKNYRNWNLTMDSMLEDVNMITLSLTHGWFAEVLVCCSDVDICLSLSKNFMKREQE